jgi:hypothetical protein
MSFRTYLCVPLGLSVDESFQNQMAYSEFSEDLSAMAVHYLDLSHIGAKVDFDLYIHHGQQPQELREHMKPVYSLRIIKGSTSGRAIIDRLHLDEDFLSCKANNGCKRCTSPTI